MVPPSLQKTKPSQEIAEVIPILCYWVRGTLVLITLGLVTVFSIAAWLNPYVSGQARRMETHRQLGLPPCTFYHLTGLPCPSCGMTTSFSLLMHGDLWNSLRANAIGTLLAVFCLALIPWNLACAWWGRPFWVVSLERALARLIIIFLVLMLIRWVIVLGLAWGTGMGPKMWKNGDISPQDSWRRDHGGTLETVAFAHSDFGGRGLHRLRPGESSLLPHGRG